MSETQGNENKGIVGEIVDEFRTLEQKIENLIHPDKGAEGDGIADPASSNASSTESQSGSAAGADAGNDLAANAASLTASEGSATTAISPIQSAQVAQENGPTGAGAQSEPDLASQQSSLDTVGAAAGGDEGNAGASNAGVAAGAGTQSSAAIASLSGDTGAVVASSVSASLANEARGSILKIRKFLWTFGQGAVADLHAELDKLEKLF